MVEPGEEPVLPAVRGEQRGQSRQEVGGGGHRVPQESPRGIAAPPDGPHGLPRVRPDLQNETGDSTGYDIVGDLKDERGDSTGYDR